MSLESKESQELVNLAYSKESTASTINEFIVSCIFNFYNIPKYVTAYIEENELWKFIDYAKISMGNFMIGVVVLPVTRIVEIYIRIIRIIRKLFVM